MSRLNFLKAQTTSSADQISDPKKVSEMYKYWRVRQMYSIFIGYAIFYFCRKNLSAATPALIADLGYSKTAIGSIWSVMYLVYGVAKLVNGVLGDRANSRYFMAIGIFFSALTNIWFGMSSSLMVLGLSWALNGWFQSMGGPTCARVLTHWYSPNEIGTKWGFWNISHQVGGGIILILGGYLTQHYGWRSSFFVPAAIGIVTAFFLVNRMRDTPESMGLPEVEEYRQDFSNPEGMEKSKKAKASSIKEVLMSDVLRNRSLWLLAIANFFVYIVRYGAMDWAPTYLVEVKGSSISNASFKTALFEFLGIAGSIAAGWLSDKYFLGRRSLVNVIFMAVLAFAIVGFWLIPGGHPMLDGLLLSAVGFLVYGPQTLVGVCAADVAGKENAATANGMTGLLGYLGSIVSGVGTGWIVERYGWGGGFALFGVASLIGAVCFAATGEKKTAVRPFSLGPLGIDPKVKESTV
jgi:OPA family sugar phosphate sensor protein UhpC-like MFS transporter